MIFASKKGNVMDLLFLGIFIIIIAIVIGIISYTYSIAGPEISATMEEGSVAKEIIDESEGGYASLWDSIIIFIFIFSFRYL